MTEPLSPKALAELDAELKREGVPHPTGLIPLVAIRSGSNVVYLKQETFTALIAAAEEAGRLEAEIRHRVRFSEWSPTEAEFVLWREKYRTVVEAARETIRAAVKAHQRGETFPMDVALGIGHLEDALDALDKAG